MKRSFESSIVEAKFVNISQLHIWRAMCCYQTYPNIVCWITLNRIWAHWGSERKLFKIQWLTMQKSIYNKIISIHSLDSWHSSFCKNRMRYRKSIQNDQFKWFVLMRKDLIRIKSLCSIYLVCSVFNGGVAAEHL